MIRLTVDVAAASAGKPGIRIEDLATGRVFFHKRVALDGIVIATQGERQRDGAVAWVEADGYAVIE